MVLLQLTYRKVLYPINTVTGNAGMSVFTWYIGLANIYLKHIIKNIKQLSCVYKAIVIPW